MIEKTLNLEICDLENSADCADFAMMLGGMSRILPSRARYVASVETPEIPEMFNVYDVGWTLLGVIVYENTIQEASGSLLRYVAVR